ncbi:MAG: helix-hairpin-helix domain-containing protein [Roseateles sp.]|uniref:helix-hairpin-helix domain-containing protein n=1 Tax=Roseateles sp. TaxID=1971397 RepID=UPI0039E8700F
MHPQKVARARIRRFTDLPNIGPAAARDLVLLGFEHPGQLQGCDPLALYKELCRRTGAAQDPCVLDVFMSVVDFLDGNPARPWWHYTALRKQRYGALLRSTPA